MLRKEVSFYHRVPVEAQISDVDYQSIHFHDAFEVILVLEGRLEVKDGYAIDQIEKGSIWFFDNKCLHSIKGLADQNKILSVFVDLNYFEKIFPGVTKNFFASVITEEESFREIKKLATAQLLDLALYRTDNIIVEEKAVEEISTAFIRNIYDNYRSFGLSEGVFVNEIKQKDNYIMVDRMQRILQHIENDYDHKLTLNEIAQREHLNVYYLSRLIKKTTKMGFYDLLSIERVENSEKLLLETRKKDSEIAKECGFSATRYYREAFVKWYGCFPDKYRERMIYEADNLKEQMHTYSIVEAHQYLIEFVKSNGNVVRYDRFDLSEEIIEIDTNSSGPSIEKDIEHLHNELFYGKIDSLQNHQTENVINTISRELGINKLNILVEEDTSFDNFDFREATRGIDQIKHHGIELIFHVKGDVTKKKLLRFQEYYSEKSNPEKQFKIVEKVNDEAARGNEYIPWMYSSYVYAAIIVKAFFDQQDTRQFVIIDAANQKADILEGDNGVISSNGNKKPCYTALKALCNLKGHCIFRGENCNAFADKNECGILLYNISDEEIDSFKRVSDRNQMEELLTTRGSSKKIKLRVKNLNGNYRIVKQRVDEENCLFLAWKNLNYADVLTWEEEDLLSHISMPHRSIEHKIIDDVYEFEVQLDPYEMVSINIERI